MSFGIGMGPNGQIGPVVMLTNTAPEPPTDQTFAFETSDEIYVSVYIADGNTARGETIRSDLVEKMGWTSVRARESESPPSYASAFGYAVLFALIIPFVLFFAGMVMGGIWMMANFDPPSWLNLPTYNSDDAYIALCTRWALYSVPVIFTGVLLTGLVEAWQYRRAKKRL